MGKIEIEGMHFFARHGHFEAERIAGNDFLVDISLETDCRTAAKTDKLEDALNYQAIYDLIKKEMQITSHLLEHVAGRILNALYAEFPNIDHAQIKISKLNPPMGGQIEKASVIMARSSGKMK